MVRNSAIQARNRCLGWADRMSRRNSRKYCQTETLPCRACGIGGVS